jgi:anion-transporting  ArsA/GET3 family ATPase
MTVLAVAIQKGGVGKTTTTLSVGKEAQSERSSPRPLLWLHPRHLDLPALQILARSLTI